MGCNGCTLDNGEMAERVNEWRAVSSRAISREVHAGKITSAYPPDPDLIGRLKALIAAEAVCCSFLEFTIEEQRHQTMVELTFPEEAKALVESVIAAPTTAR
ncbi:MAG: hypothetical protein M3217_08555 [Actinomycetota bacterium]|nr:hypothetical protein [Actinomycetota bacterium]